MSATKTKKAKGTGGGPIKWFAEQVAHSKDLDKLREAAKEQKYSDSTISIQIGRLRKAGLLPPAPKAEKKPKEAKEKVRKIRPQPKPSQAKAANG